jgi:hypothetical protein
MRIKGRHAVADFSHTRRWWPHFLIDEVTPEGRISPEAWLAPDENGVTTLHWGDEPESGVAGKLIPGEVVEFMWQEDRGSVDILLMPNGSWSLDDTRDGGTIDMFTGQAIVPPPPSTMIDQANWFAAADDFETCMDSMDSFAEAYAECGDVDPDGERITVDMCFWSDGERFRVSDDGKSLEPPGIFSKLTRPEAHHG